MIAVTVACLLLIGYATLTSHSGRPVLLGRHESLGVVIFERFAAYLVLGFLLSWLFPGRMILTCAIVAGIAISLELLQDCGDRDPAALDALQKATGGIVGVLASRWLSLQHRK
ncbi:VanZ family protein [Bradyrhizobium sp. ISRA443]|uniref:VanZ family protein n=1 Tax=unclassified Bradyrhizobium TaxID=2631580 RepID=UPI002478C363|nr:MULTISPECIES: VanZ family protein [unclassified Bradyrhizobium]WGR97245.1 VanZ family protein [Bradyrhizobium sp. ISRA436]WGS04134.1 VanZ family protein [Bradyrhizobium sp. ISRA437]WGS11017.1 VanZ family protein [Bradyrhizobium sp. ISRA443]